MMRSTASIKNFNLLSELLDGFNMLRLKHDILSEMEAHEFGIAFTLQDCIPVLVLKTLQLQWKDDESSDQLLSLSRLDQL